MVCNANAQFNSISAHFNKFNQLNPTSAQSNSILNTYFKYKMDGSKYEIQNGSNYQTIPITLTNTKISPTQIIPTEAFITEIMLLNILSYYYIF